MPNVKFAQRQRRPATADVDIGFDVASSGR
jgi:hypothetical protein